MCWGAQRGCWQEEKLSPEREAARPALRPGPTSPPPLGSLRNLRRAGGRAPCQGWRGRGARPARAAAASPDGARLLTLPGGQPPGSPVTVPAAWNGDWGSKRHLGCPRTGGAGKCEVSRGMSKATVHAPKNLDRGRGQPWAPEREGHGLDSHSSKGDPRVPGAPQETHSRGCPHPRVWTVTRTEPEGQRVQSSPPEALGA